jgi:hypothetical protein
MLQVEEKVKKVKSTYGINKMDVDKDGDDEATVEVTHQGSEKKLTNSDEPIRIRLMSPEELKKLAEAGKKDLQRHS